MIIVAAFATSILLLAASLLLQLRLRRDRRRRLSKLELRPNCLLTRYPLVFVSGRRSVFRLFDHWNDIPSFLREHGYDVLVIEPPARVNRPKAVLEALETLHGKAHVIADSSLEDDVMAIARVKNPAIATLTVVKNPRRAEDSSLRASFRLATVDDLKPLASSVESFELEPSSSSLSAISWRERASLLLLAAHNTLALGREPAVDAIETGHLIGSDWPIESSFLDLAISLAERDAMGCH